MEKEKFDLEWFPLYVDQFIMDTAQWNDAEVGVYIRLLCSQWRNGYLIDDHDRLRAITSVKTLDEFNIIWGFVGKKFIKGDDGFLRNRKLEEVRKEQETKAGARKKSGETAAKARWDKFKKPTIADIKEYCDERKNGIDPEAFFNYYESKGWKIGKSPMKKWKAAIITWEKINKQKRKSPHELGEQNYSEKL